MACKPVTNAVGTLARQRCLAVVLPSSVTFFSYHRIETFIPLLRQQVEFVQGIRILNICKDDEGTSSILDDFKFYEDCERKMHAGKESQAEQVSETEVFKDPATAMNSHLLFTRLLHFPQFVFQRASVYHQIHIFEIHWFELNLSASSF